MASVIQMEGEELSNAVSDLCIQEQKEIQKLATSMVGSENHHGFCAICLDKILLEETALVKGCEHAYCVTCILRWATYNQNPKCPQCKHPFEFLNVHRALDGRIHDYMFEESVCLLARATWFKPLPVENQKMAYEDDLGDFYMYEGDNDEDDDLEEVYFNNTASLRIGNRRWGDNGYVRSGRQEARPIHRHDLHESSSASSSREYPKKKELGSNSKDTHGRRARRALKREAADKAAASKHEQHLVRLGRK